MNRSGRDLEIQREEGRKGETGSSSGGGQGVGRSNYIKMAFRPSAPAGGPCRRDLLGARRRRGRGDQRRETARGERRERGG
jgi:hypothetical protein